MRIPSPEQLQPVAEQYDLRLIVLFGSQVKGRTHADSDADIAILLERPLSAAERLDLWSALIRLFEAEVDLTTLNQVEPLLLYQVVSSGRPLYESKEWAWENLKSYGYRRYWDSAKFFKDMARYVSQRAEEMRRAG